MQRFGNVRFYGIQPQPRRCDAREGQHILADDHVGFAEDRVIKAYIHAERLPVGLSREPALGSKTEANTLREIIPDGRKRTARAHLECHEVTEWQAARMLKMPPADPPVCR